VTTPTSSRLADALEWLDGHWNLEAGSAGVAQGTSPRAPSLERIARLMDLSADPQRAYPSVHVTGTNGKTSTARILAALLDAMGLAVGTYTSPHLERLNERIAAPALTDGRRDRHQGALDPIPDDDLAAQLESLRGLEPMLGGGARASWFELVTAAAFRHFADVVVDAAVVEVGLGGRWDATNVVDGRVSVVTNVGLDHMEYLGPTRQDIAREKAGIIKAGAVVIVGEPDPAIQEVFAAATGAAGAEAMWVAGRDFECEGNEPAVDGRLLDLRTPGGEYHEVFLNLHGRHQGSNAVVALAAAEAFFGRPLEAAVVKDALGRVTSPGRLEIVAQDPLTVLDGAHNPAGAVAAAAALVEEFGQPARRQVVVLGLLRGHDPEQMLTALDPSHISLVVACPAPSPRALPAAEVADAARRLGLAAVEEASVAEAVASARAEAGEGQMVLVTGSLYVVGAARAVLH
jgi:dihydrofolate synthase/folylpolyglutamate synthase